MYKKKVLANQLSLVMHPVANRESVSIGIAVSTGGRYEEDRLKGAAHFLEHILFKGSRHYSCTEIKALIEGVGGSLNAFTAEEMTSYFAKIPAQHLARTFDILADMFFTPLIAAADVAKERTVILEEIKMYHDLPQYFVLELLDELIWPNHPLGKNLAGTAESVGAMSAKDLQGFHDQYYVPGNVVIAACGKFDPAKFAQLVMKKTAKFKGRAEKGFLPVQLPDKRPRVKFFHKDIEQMHLALGMHGISQNHPDKYALALLNVILGGNMSSRLFDEVREKRGLAYSISSSQKCLQDTGLFLIRAGVDNRKIVEAVTVILKELKKIRDRGVSSDEFKRARDYSLGQVVLGLEDTLEHMLWMQESTLVWGRIKTLPEIVEEVNKVRLADIQRVARSILSPEGLNLSLVGPVTKVQELEIRRLLKI